MIICISPDLRKGTEQRVCHSDEPWPWMSALWQWCSVESPETKDLIFGKNQEGGVTIIPLCLTRLPRVWCVTKEPVWLFLLHAVLFKIDNNLWARSLPFLFRRTFISYYTCCSSGGFSLHGILKLGGGLGQIVLRCAGQVFFSSLQPIIVRFYAGHPCMREQINTLLSFKENKGHHLQRQRKKKKKITSFYSKPM